MGPHLAAALGYHPVLLIAQGGGVGQGAASRTLEESSPPTAQWDARWRRVRPRGWRRTRWRRGRPGGGGAHATTAWPPPFDQEGVATLWERDSITCTANPKAQPLSPEPQTGVAPGGGVHQAPEPQSPNPQTPNPKQAAQTVERCVQEVVKLWERDNMALTNLHAFGRDLRRLPVRGLFSPVQLPVQLHFLGAGPRPTPGPQPTLSGPTVYFAMSCLPRSNCTPSDRTSARFRSLVHSPRPSSVLSRCDIPVQPALVFCGDLRRLSRSLAFSPGPWYVLCRSFLPVCHMRSRPALFALPVRSTRPVLSRTVLYTVSLHTHARTHTHTHRCWI